MSRIAESMSDSLSFPRERTSERVDWRRSESWSNIRSAYALDACGPLGDKGRELFGEEDGGVLGGVERAQVLEFLPPPDQLHRDAEFGGDRQRDAALRGAVELGDDD